MDSPKRMVAARGRPWWRGITDWIARCFRRANEAEVSLPTAEEGHAQTPPSALPLSGGRAPLDELERRARQASLSETAEPRISDEGGLGLTTLVSGHGVVLKFQYEDPELDANIATFLRRVGIPSPLTTTVELTEAMSRNLRVRMLESIEQHSPRFTYETAQRITNHVKAGRRAAAMPYLPGETLLAMESANRKLSSEHAREVIAVIGKVAVTDLFTGVGDRCLTGCPRAGLNLGSFLISRSAEGNLGITALDNTPDIMSHRDPLLPTLPLLFGPTDESGLSRRLHPSYDSFDGWVEALAKAVVSVSVLSELSDENEVKRILASAMGEQIGNIRRLFPTQVDSHLRHAPYLSGCARHMEPSPQYPRHGPALRH